MSEKVKELPEEDLDIDDVSLEEPVREALKGLYNLTVVKAEPKRYKGKEKESRGARVEFTVDSEYGTGNAPPYKCRIFYSVILNKDYEFMVRNMKRLSAAAGVDPIRKSADDAVAEWCEAITGSNLVGRLGPGKPNQQGKIYTEVQSCLTAEEAANVAAGNAPSGEQSASETVSADPPVTAPRRRRSA